MNRTTPWLALLALLVITAVIQPTPVSVAMVRPLEASGVRLAGGPLAREKMGMANDAPRGQVVLFGGYASSLGQDVADTWTWDGHTWSEQHPVDAPSARCCMTVAYDPATRQVVLFGGIDDQGVTQSDTWTWDGANWTHQDPGTSPDVDYGISMAFDRATRRLVLFEGHTGETWSWDGITWTPEHPPTAPSFRDGQAMSSFGRDIILFGGNQCGPSDLCELDDTWLWDGSTWTLLSPTKHPSPRCCSGAAFDSVHRRVVLFGGLVPTGVLGTTWSWNGRSWIRRQPATSPTPRSFPGVVDDSGAGGVLLFGGYTGSIDSGDTWAWDGATWTCAAGCS
jgi:hypothetical protein